MAIVLARTRLRLAALITAGAGALTLYFYNPSQSTLFPPCPVRYLTGCYCPGCGSLRALHQLLHGNLGAAWALNPLTVVLLPFIVYGLASNMGSAFRGYRLPRLFLPAIYIRGLCVAIVAFGIARNLLIFAALAPGGVLSR